MAKEAMTMKGGHLYTQTNEIENAIIHYQRGANGMLTEVERVRTGGAGSGEFKPISGQESAPNAFEGASSIFITPDRRFLFTTNGGDNSVSSFSVGQDGQLKLLDVKPTGNPVEWYGQVGILQALKQNVVCAALVWAGPRSSDVGQRRWQAYAASRATHHKHP
jgi:Lactonase, 7-bladed beta-propeller